MKENFNRMIKRIIRILIIFSITMGALVVASRIWDFSMETALFIVGAIYFFIGISTVMGDTGRRRDIQYLQVRSMGERSSMDEIGRDKIEMTKKNASIIEMSIIGILLFLVSYFL